MLLVIVYEEERFGSFFHFLFSSSVPGGFAFVSGERRYVCSCRGRRAFCVMELF